MVDKNRVTLVVCCNATNSIKIPFISEYCEAKKMTEASKLFAQFESSASAKQLSLFDMINK